MPEFQSVALVRFRLHFPPSGDESGRRTQTCADDALHVLVLLVRERRHGHPPEDFEEREEFRLLDGIEDEAADDDDGSEDEYDDDEDEDEDENEDEPEDEDED